MLEGKKTYIVGGLMVAYGIVLCATGQVEQGIKTVGEGLGLIFLRAGVEKSKGE